MGHPKSSAIDWPRFGGVLFDLDGVLTDTASLHARAWKQTFDELATATSTSSVTVPLYLHCCCRCCPSACARSVAGWAPRAVALLAGIVALGIVFDLGFYLAAR